MNKFCLPLGKVVYCLDFCDENCLLLEEFIDFLKIEERLQIGL